MIQIESIVTHVPSDTVKQANLVDGVRGRRIVILTFDLSDEAEIRRLVLARSVKIVAAEDAK